MYKIKLTEVLPRGIAEEEHTGFATQKEARAKIDEMIDQVLERIHAPVDLNDTTDNLYDVQDDGSSIGVHDHVNDITYVYKIEQE